MSASLFSRDWYRIGELKPRVREHITVHAHRYRGRRWYLLEDHMTGQVRRLTAQSYLIFGRMNGERTVDELWDIASRRLGEDMPTHEELLQLLASLYQSNLIRMDISGDVSELFERGSEAKRKRWMGKLKSPLSIQIPLLDPDRFLQATLKYVRPVFTRSALALYCVLLFSMLFLVGRHWDELTGNIVDNVLAADNLALLWFIYPVIKIFHELGHGYCIKRNGGEVHELGIMLLVLMPMPYVDASASSAFPDKKQRMLVGLAGILVELFFAALAMLVWINAEPGLAKSIAFNIMFIAGVSTVLMNGNPLLRFDGYYVLADYLEIPNLAQRATTYWGWLVKRLLFGVTDVESPANDRREALWLFWYGLSALIYRLFLTVTIFLFVAQKYFLLGVILALWSLTGTLLWPNLKLLFTTWRDSQSSSGSRSPRIMMPLVGGLFVLALFALPLPLSTSIEGIVRVNDERRVLAGENCFVTEVTQSAGALVAKGEQLLSCSNPRLEATKITLAQQYIEVLAQRQGAWDDPVQISIYEEELARLGDEIAVNRKQLESLRLYSQAEGVWWVKSAVDLPGRFLSRGDLVGYVTASSDVSVLGMIPESDIELIRDHLLSVEVIRASSLNQALKPTNWHIFPAATTELVSDVLGEEGGGSIVVDPSDPSAKALQRYFLIELKFASVPNPRVEERVLVKFNHPAEPVIYRLYRLVRRTFLQYFNV